MDITEQQQELIESNGGKASPELASQLLEQAMNGDTTAQAAETGSEPDTTQADEAKTPEDTTGGTQQAQEQAQQHVEHGSAMVDESQLNVENSVILRVNQARFPVDLGNVMSQIRSPADLRRLGRPVAQNLMDRYCDQSLIVHMAGARGSHDNIEWVIPKDSHKDFNEIMVNRVKAPTRNRHYVVDGSGMQGVTSNAGELDIATTDLFTMDAVDSMKTVLDQIALPPPIVKFEGDANADDSPIRVSVVVYCMNLKTMMFVRLIY
ncbi:MAG TPA: DUF4043 domain-containing protein [Acinetobacter ursingii]|uniref:DUF4043 domain-containing protein n=1 Tax=Acinetobacter ursingii TaxID=108980 RepID=A0A3D2SJ38_9GAMM|nr:DUF4043 domain-containing protein [Acinetobacter ursingii]HCO08713.1 DUF4043 domain-containing protein [Acinetobacter ursingii]